MSGAFWWLGAAVLGVIVTKAATRLYENAEKHYRRELNPKAETGFMSAYRRGVY